MADIKTIVQIVKEIDKNIVILRKGMSHSHAYAVDRLRSSVEELEDIRDVILSSEIKSEDNLEVLLQSVRECIRECLHPTYTGKSQVLPRPSLK